MAKGRLIVLEGAEGVGKSSQAARLRDRLTHGGHDVELIREPGGTPVGEQVRDILLSPGRELVPASEALLFMASRAAVTEERIKPAIARGATVIHSSRTSIRMPIPSYLPVVLSCSCPSRWPVRYRLCGSPSSRIMPSIARRYSDVSASVSTYCALMRARTWSNSFAPFTAAAVWPRWTSQPPVMHAAAITIIAVNARDRTRFASFLACEGETRVRSGKFQETAGAAPQRYGFPPCPDCRSHRLREPVHSRGAPPAIRA